MTSRTTRDALEQQVRDITRGRHGVPTESALAKHMCDGGRLQYSSAPAWTPYEAAMEIAFVQVLYADTEYAAMLQDILPRVAQACKDAYSVSWTDAWEAVKEHVPALVKAYAMHRRGNMMATWLPPVTEKEAKGTVVPRAEQIEQALACPKD